MGPVRGGRAAADVEAAYGGTVAAGVKSDSAANRCDFDITGTAKAGKVTVIEQTKD